MSLDDHIGSQSEEDTYSEEETVARREATLKRMLATPHKPRKSAGKTAERKP